MKDIGIIPTEHIPHQKFWADVNKKIKGLEDLGYIQKECLCT